MILYIGKYLLNDKLFNKKLRTRRATFKYLYTILCTIIILRTSFKNNKYSLDTIYNSYYAS